MQSYVLGSKLPLLSYGRDGLQPNSRGLYTPYKDSLRWDDHPQYKEFNPGHMEAIGEIMS